MKRKLKWLAIVLAVSLLGFGTALLLWPRDRITAESWQKIRIGMTEDEVVKILGGPGINRDEYWHLHFGLEKELGRFPFEFKGAKLQEPEAWLQGDETKFWTGQRGMIIIELDQDNKVCLKSFQGVRWINQGFLDRLRDWLGW
jgi:hypothetical protein